MKVHLLKDWLGFNRAENRCRTHKTGEDVSVYHAHGTRLIHRRMALWIRQEAGDPEWTPAAPLIYQKAAEPQHNRMITGGLNR